MDDFVLNWKKVLGWHRDPFERKDDEVSYLGGYEKEREKLNLFILKGCRFGSIIGKEGTGKTIIMHWLLANLQRHKSQFRVVFLHKDDFLHEKTIIRKICEPFLTEHPIKGMLAKLAGKYQKLSKKNVHEYLRDYLDKKRYVLLIEDAHLLKKVDMDMLERILSVPNTSVILAAQKELAKNQKKKLGKDELAFELKRLDFEGAKAMLQKRIESAGGTGVWPFSDTLLKDLFSLADYNPSRILRLCQEKVKELSIEVKTGKILPAEKQNGKHAENDYSWNNEMPNNEMPCKAKKGFGIVFSIKHDEPKKEIVEKAPEEIVDEKLVEPAEPPHKKKEEDHAIVIDFGMPQEHKPKHKKQEKKEVVLHLDKHHKTKK